MKYHPKLCAYCGEEFVPQRSNKKFCSDTCKQYNYLSKKTGKRHGVDIGRADLITKYEQLVQLISEPSQITLVSGTSPPTITVTYEYLSKSPTLHPPSGILLRKWYPSFTG